MNPIDIIDKYYDKDTDLYRIFLSHSQSVSEKAINIARNHPEMSPDIDFIYEAAMLHDIGIFMTYAPEIYCFGEEPYLCHGYLGNSLLQREGYKKHALVCERHTGMGFDVKYIIENNLPLPHRNMMPESVEEQMICFADKFFSKTNLEEEKSIEKIRKSMIKYGQAQVDKFDQYCNLFL